MSKLNLLAVTACISGVAHTYMAAEHIEKLAQQENWSIKIETQGALGIENAINSDDIDNADVVILISNTKIKNRERFEHLRNIEIDISHFLLNNRSIVGEIKKIINRPKGSKIQLK